MQLNYLLFSLAYLVGTLTLAAAQKDDPSHRHLRRSMTSSLRHQQKPSQPEIELSTWMTQKKAYANEYANLSSQTVENDSEVLPTDIENGIQILLSQSYQFKSQFVADEPAAEYAILSIESVENEYVTQSSQARDEDVQDDTAQDEPVACPSGDGVDYKGTDADICSRIRFFCEEGLEYFGAGDCGCGCKPVA